MTSSVIFKEPFSNYQCLFHYRVINNTAAHGVEHLQTNYIVVLNNLWLPFLIFNKRKTTNLEYIQNMPNFPKKLTKVAGKHPNKQIKGTFHMQNQQH